MRWVCLAAGNVAKEKRTVLEDIAEKVTHRGNHTHNAFREVTEFCVARLYLQGERWERIYMLGVIHKGNMGEIAHWWEAWYYNK